jgi:hypothetical protein
MPDEEPMRPYQEQQEELHVGDHRGAAGDPLSRTLTIALIVGIGICIALILAMLLR